MGVWRATWADLRSHQEAGRFCGGGAGGSGLQGPLEGEEAAFRLGGGSPGSLVMPVAMVGGGDSP